MNEDLASTLMPVEVDNTEITRKMQQVFAYIVGFIIRSAIFFRSAFKKAAKKALEKASSFTEISPDTKIVVIENFESHCKTCKAILVMDNKEESSDDQRYDYIKTKSKKEDSLVWPSKKALDIFWYMEGHVREHRRDLFKSSINFESNFEDFKQ